MSEEPSGIERSCAIREIKLAGGGLARRWQARRQPRHAGGKGGWAGGPRGSSGA